MTSPRSPFRRAIVAGTALGLIASPLAAHAAGLQFGNLYFTVATYGGNAGTVTLGQALPNSNGATAIADGSYPGVFANDSVDANFGISSSIHLYSFASLSLPSTGVLVGPGAGAVDVTARTGVTSSFSSKSELAINPSTDGTALTLSGYTAPLNLIDVSNANTDGHVDPTNTDTQIDIARTEVEIDLGGGVKTTQTSAYSGNNGRAVTLIRGATPAQDAYVMVGNAGNGSGIEPVSVVASTGVQTIAPGSASPASTVVGAPQGTAGQKNGFEYGFSVASLGYPADKSGKDDNFRGLTVFAGNVYVTKGSGGNGVNTVYKVGITGGAANIAANASTATITPLPGFPTTLASSAATNFFPFGIWFANATTLYVADEGSQNLTADSNAGLQKWVFDGAKWNLAYVLQAGLNLDQTYTVPNYPTIDQPSTTGLRNITGEVNGNAVTLFAATATYSGLADPGGDPNSIVQITDQLDATTPPPAAEFRTTFGPIAGLVYRGVAYLDCTSAATCRRNGRITAN